MKRFAIALLFCLATTTLFAQQYCRRPEQPRTQYCSTTGDWNDIARCQNDNVNAIQQYNREAEEYNECIEQNREAERQKEEKKQRMRQYCSQHPNDYDCN